MKTSNVRNLVLVAIAASALSAHALDPAGPVARVDGGTVVETRSGGLPDRYADTYPYRSAGSARWLADGWREWVQAAPCASNEQVASRSWSIDATQAVESVVCESKPAWTNTADYAARVKAAGIVATIQATLAQISVQPTTREQVFADVRAWAYAQNSVQAALIAMDLSTAYQTLAGLVGDVSGLIAGTRAVSLQENTPIVIDAEE